MKCKQRLKWLQTKSLTGNEEGFVLIVSLMFLVILTLVGTTAYVMTSTDIKVGGNFKNYQRVLQVADAGAERGREQLRVANASSTNKKSFNDELSDLDRVGINTVLEGYGGDDEALFTDTLGGITYVAYVTNNAADGGISNQVDNDNRVLITSVATGPNGAFARVEKEAAIVQGPPVVSTSYSEGDVTGNGNAMSISGVDACGQESTLPEIYTVTGAEVDMNPMPDDITTETGADVVDINDQINSIKPGATEIVDPDTADFGDSNNYVSLYSQPDPNPPTNGELTLNNISGYGTLLVDGDLTITGGFDWHGLVLVTGTLTLSGGGHETKSISGAVYANNTITYNGNIDIQYDSCAIANSMTGWPLQPLSWKQVY